MIRRSPPHGLAGEVSGAARRPRAARALILDVDGTLAPIAPTPAAARVPAGVLASLRALVGRGWKIAVVSGRPAAQARAMVPIEGVAVYGSHGVERAGRELPRGLGATRRRIESIARAARALAHEFPGVGIERKPVGVAFHDRALSRDQRARWRRRLRTWLETRDLRGLEILSGKQVIELRPAGAGKARVARVWPPARTPGRDRSLVVIGDDRTDEDLFGALAGHAVTIRVGPPGVRSAARRRLASTAAVARFLAALAEPSGKGGER